MHASVQHWIVHLHLELIGRRRTELDIIPMRQEIVEPPKDRCDDLRAELLGERDIPSLESAICMIGAKADPETVAAWHENEFDFAARLPTDDLDDVAAR